MRKFFKFFFNFSKIKYINMECIRIKRGQNLRTEKIIREKLDQIEHTYGDAFDFEVPHDTKIIYKTLKWVLEEIDNLS